MATKKGILQWDVDLNFQTKKLSANLSGYFSRSQASLGSKLMMYYKFVNESSEKIDVEFKISDRSTNLLMFKQFDVRMISTKYPQYNIEAKTKFQVSVAFFVGIKEI